jgi:hypothetical protein
MAGSQLRGIDVLPIHEDPRHGAAVPVRIHCFDLHRLSVHHGRQILLPDLAERLSGLGRVNAVKPDFHQVVPVAQDGDRVAVEKSGTKPCAGKRSLSPISTQTL